MCSVAATQTPKHTGQPGPVSAHPNAQLESTAALMKAIGPAHFRKVFTAWCVQSGQGGLDPPLSNARKIPRAAMSFGNSGTDGKFTVSFPRIGTRRIAIGSKREMPRLSPFADVV
jgi:hypothetical protein